MIGPQSEKLTANICFRWYEIAVNASQPVLRPISKQIAERYAGAGNMIKGLWRDAKNTRKWVGRRHAAFLRSAEGVLIGDEPLVCGGGDHGFRKTTHNIRRS